MYRPFDDEARDWRYKVMNRDRRTCQDCGAKARYAHHVKPWKDCPELRYDPDNGIALCIPYHKRKHGHYIMTPQQQAELEKTWYYRARNPVISTVTLSPHRNTLTSIPLTLTTRMDGALCLT